MSLASRRFRSRRVPRFSPANDDQIGELRGGGVFASQRLLDWFDMVAVRLENMITPTGQVDLFLGAREPEGRLFLNGQQVDGKKYRRLGEFLGQSGDILTLPDYRDRIPMGAGNIVELGGFAGAAQIIQTVEQLARHGHPIIDLGHKHAAIDRGHGHDLQMDSHTHDIAEDADNKHTHPIDDPGHVHGGVARESALSVVANGSDRPVVQNNNTASATTGITVLESEDDLVLTASEEELTGTISGGRADIRVHESKSNISLGTQGDSAPMDIIPPVFGVNWMIKA